MRKVGVNVTVNPVNNNIRFMDRTGTLMIKPNQCSIDPDEINVNYPHYNYNQSSDDESEELSFEAKFIKIKTYKELDNATIGLGKDLHRLLEHVHKLPDNPPVRDRSIFNKKEKYRAALIDHLDEIHSVEEFQFFSGSQSTELVNCNDSGNKKIETSVAMTHAIRSFNTSKTVHIRVQEVSLFKDMTDDFKNIVKELSEHIYHSVMGEAKEQGSKEIARRKELRFHVELLKSYLGLQGFCEVNLCRRQGETTKSQAKSLISHYYPLISIANMDLMLQRTPRIYRLLKIANYDWRFLDCFEGLSSCFFKSGIMSATNFEIWINLVRTGKLINYEEVKSQERKRVNKEIKIEVIEEYFDVSGVSFDEINDDDE